MVKKYLPIDETGNLDFSAYVERTAQGEHSVWIPILIVAEVRRRKTEDQIMPVPIVSLRWGFLFFKSWVWGFGDLRDFCF